MLELKSTTPTLNATRFHRVKPHANYLSVPLTVSNVRSTFSASFVFRRDHFNHSLGGQVPTNPLLPFNLCIYVSCKQFHLKSMPHFNCAFFFRYHISHLFCTLPCHATRVTIICWNTASKYGMSNKLFAHLSEKGHRCFLVSTRENSSFG